MPRSVYEYLKVCTFIAEDASLHSPAVGTAVSILAFGSVGKAANHRFINKLYSFRFLLRCLFYEEVKKHKPDFSSRGVEDYYVVLKSLSFQNFKPQHLNGSFTK